MQQEYADVFGHPLVEGFGMTEGLPVLANHPDDNRPGSMGQPLGDVEIRVVDGEMWFRGRRKEIIVRGGSNISPQEVEETLYRHPAVAEAGVIREQDDYWGEVVLAYVALRTGHQAAGEELVSFARQHLAEYKCPERVLFLPVLPEGHTGKIQRRALKEQRAKAAGI
jgi:acyl-CoA synthetase (AMP-forming)/AMP-acid ligase II